MNEADKKGTFAYRQWLRQILVLYCLLTFQSAYQKGLFSPVLLRF